MENNNKTINWLAIDTDAGVDDAVAICLLFKHTSSYQIKLINSVQGNCNVNQVVTNVAKCLNVCQNDNDDNGNSKSERIPIGLGSEKALDGSQVDATFFHGKDGLGDVTDGTIPTPELYNTDNVDAVQSLIDLAILAKQTPNVKLTLLALGPLTNVAKTMMIADERLNGDDNQKLMNMIDELVIMGGCGNARGNITRVAEFNVYNDVDAAAHVFQHWTKDNITVVPWEYCVKHAISWDRYDAVFGLNNPKHTQVGTFLSKILHRTYGERDGGSDEINREKHGAVICDPMAAAYCLNPQIAKSHQFVHVEVECKSETTKGMTVVDWGSYDGANRKKNVKWLLDMDDDLYFRYLKELCIRD